MEKKADPARVYLAALRLRGQGPFLFFFSKVQGVFPRLERHFHDPTKSTSPCPEALRLWSYSQVVFPVGKTREDVFSSLASILERMENVSYDFR